MFLPWAATHVHRLLSGLIHFVFHHCQEEESKSSLSTLQAPVIEGHLTSLCVMRGREPSWSAGWMWSPHLGCCKSSVPSGDMVHAAQLQQPLWPTARKHPGLWVQRTQASTYPTVSPQRMGFSCPKAAFSAKVGV